MTDSTQLKLCRWKKKNFVFSLSEITSSKQHLGINESFSSWPIAQTILLNTMTFRGHLWQMETQCQSAKWLTHLRSSLLTKLTGSLAYLLLTHTCKMVSQVNCTDKILDFKRKKQVTETCGDQLPTTHPWFVIWQPLEGLSTKRNNQPSLTRNNPGEYSRNY